MLIDINGNAECDRCGVALALAPITLALIVSDLDKDGRVRTRHFCRYPVDGAPNGCAGKLMSPSNLEHADKADKVREKAQQKAMEAQTKAQRSKVRTKP